MKITIDHTPEQVELIKAMGSNDRAVAYEAQAAVAQLLSPIVNEVVNNAVTMGNLFTNLPFGEDENVSLPLDLYYDITDEDYIKVYSQQVAGGLPYNQVFPAHDELKVGTYTLDSAVAFDRKYARKSRLDVVGKTFTRLAQEVMLKTEKTAANIVLSALLNATSAGANHFATVTTANQFTLADFNNLILKSKRINSSFFKGTPVGGVRAGLTDLVVSPEIIAEVRSIAYQPVNTRTVDGSAGTPAGSSTAMPAPEQLRQQIYSAAGVPEIYGISLIEINEMGVNQRWNKIFAAINASTSTVSFTQASDEFVLGLDRTRDALLRPVIREEGSQDNLRISVDDQFVTRQNKVGWYGMLEEGRLCIDDRALVGMVV